MARFNVLVITIIFLFVSFACSGSNDKPTVQDLTKFLDVFEEDIGYIDLNSEIYTELGKANPCFDTMQTEIGKKYFTLIKHQRQMQNTTRFIIELTDYAITAGARRNKKGNFDVPIGDRKVEITSIEVEKDEKGNLKSRVEYTLTVNKLNEFGELLTTDKSECWSFHIKKALGGPGSVIMLKKKGSDRWKVPLMSGKSF